MESGYNISNRKRFAKITGGSMNNSMKKNIRHFFLLTALAAGTIHLVNRFIDMTAEMKNILKTESGSYDCFFLWMVQTCEKAWEALYGIYHRPVGMRPLGQALSDLYQLPVCTASHRFYSWCDRGTPGCCDDRQFHLICGTCPEYESESSRKHHCDQSACDEQLWPHTGQVFLCQKDTAGAADLGNISLQCPDTRIQYPADTAENIF